MTKRSVERIVTTYAMHQHDRRISVSLATVEPHFESSGTRLTFTESGAYLDEFDNPETREQGTAEVLDALGAYLDGRKTGRALASAVEGG